VTAEKQRAVRDIEERTFRFALNIVKLCQPIDGNAGLGRVLARQLLRSGASVGANVEEAQAGQSRADFISKYSIALKEMRKHGYWLRLLVESKFLATDMAGPLVQEAADLCRILGAIVSRSKQIR
jgi:four helix bundle protein